MKRGPSQVLLPPSFPPSPHSSRRWRHLPTLRTHHPAPSVASAIGMVGSLSLSYSFQKGCQLGPNLFPSRYNRKWEWFAPKNQAFFLRNEVVTSIVYKDLLVWFKKGRFLLLARIFYPRICIFLYFFLLDLFVFNKKKVMKLKKSFEIMLTIHFLCKETVQTKFRMHDLG